MNRDLLRPITDDEIRAYDEDGAVCIRGQFDRGWIGRMLALVEANRENPAGRVLESGDDEPGKVIANSHMARSSAAFMDFVRHSPAREIAARLMGLDEVRFFYDQLFIKDPGTRMPTAWHHDLPFWPLAGNHVASVWLALTPVTRATSGLVYVAGSHRWDRMYRAGPRRAARGLRARRGGRVSRLPAVPQGVRQPGLPVPLLGHGGGRLHRPPPDGGARRGRQPGRRAAQGGAVVPLLRRRHRLVRARARSSTSPAPRRRRWRRAPSPPTTICSPWCGGRGRRRRVPLSTGPPFPRWPEGGACRRTPAPPSSSRRLMHTGSDLAGNFGLLAIK